MFDISVEKVILVFCSSGALLSLKDEAIFTEKVGGIFQDTGKGIMVWMRHGSLAVEPYVLAQMIMAPGLPLERPKPRTSYQDDFSRPSYTTQFFDPDGTDRQGQTGGGNSEFLVYEMYQYGSDARCKDQTLQQSQDFVPSHPPAVRNRFTAHFNSKGELILLKTRLHHGKISYEPKDIDILYPEFKVPSHIQESLFENYMHTSEAVVEIVQDPKSNEVRWSVDPKSKRSGEHKETMFNATNETVVLETRVRYGEVSWKKNDLKFIYPDWCIPLYLMESLKHKYHATPDAKLCVISDVYGNLRSIVETDIVDKAMNFFKKTKKKITD